MEGRVCGCQWHFKSNVRNHVNKVGPEERENFSRYCDKLCECTTVVQYDEIFAELRKNRQSGNLGKGTCTSFGGHFSYALLKQISVKCFCCKCHKQWDLPIGGLSTGDQLKQASLKIPDHINGKHNSVFSSFLEEEEHLLQGQCDVWKLWQKVHLGGRRQRRLSRSRRNLASGYLLKKGPCIL